MVLLTSLHKEVTISISDLLLNSVNLLRDAVDSASVIANICVTTITPTETAEAVAEPATD